MTGAVTKLSSHLAQTIIGQAANEIADASKFPVETANLIALCAASWAVGVNYKICFYDGKSIPVNLFFMAEARSGEGKSRVLGALTKGMRDAIEQEAAGRAKIRREVMHGFDENTGGDKRKASQMEIEVMERELAENHELSHSASDITGAAFDIMLTNQHGWFVLKSTEQGLIDSLLLGKHTDNSANIDPVLNAFDGEVVETRRAGRVGFSGIPHGGIGVISQSGLIEKIMEVSGNRGLTQRFFMLIEPSMMGRRTFSRHTNEMKSLDEFNAICRTIVSSAFKNIKVMHFKNLRELHISDEGWDLIYEFKNKVEPMLGPGGSYEPAILSSMWSKLEIFVMKTASTLHIISGGDPLKSIGSDTVTEALIIVDCLFTGVSNIAERKGIVGMSIERRTVLEYLESKTKFKGIDATAIKNALSRRKAFSEYQDNKSKRVMEVVKSLVKDCKVSESITDGNSVYKFVKY